MDTKKARSLIKKSIVELLDCIYHNNHAHISSSDLLSGYRLDVEDVYFFTYENHEQALCGITSDEASLREFDHVIAMVLESDWFREHYESYQDDLAYEEASKQDWAQTKKSLQPTWTPQQNKTH